MTLRDMFFDYWKDHNCTLDYSFSIVLCNGDKGVLWKLLKPRN